MVAHHSFGSDGRHLGCALPFYLQMEVVAWVNNNWQTQWISGYVTADVGRLEVQVGGVLPGKLEGLIRKAMHGLKELDVS
jgi:hypothetical protein